jgi:CHASE2 domain-containing sensor protein
LYKFVLILLLFGLITSCGQPQSDQERSKIAIDSTIILINYKSVDRATIAKGIATINKCNPKVIGINAVFLGLKDPKKDSMLSLSFSERRNIVLAIEGEFTGTGDENKLIHSDPFFTQNTLSEGLIYYGYTNDKVTSHLQFKSVDGKVVWSFPVNIATHYNPLKGVKFMNEFSGDTYYQINFKRNLSDFVTLDIENLENLDCASIDGKIVLIGYLGPTDNDKFSTTSKEYNQMYSTVIIGNIILDLLNGESFKQDR